MYPLPNPISPNLRNDLEAQIRSATTLEQLKMALLGVLDLLVTDVADNRTLITRLIKRVG
jgi:hypothetical protein